MTRQDPHTQLSDHEKELLTKLYFDEPEKKSVDDLAYRPAMTRIALRFNEARKLGGKPELSEGDVWRALKRIGKSTGGGLSKKDRPQ